MNISMPPAGLPDVDLILFKKKLVTFNKTKDPKIIAELGGIEGALSILQTDPTIGIRGDNKDLRERTRHYGSNRYRYDVGALKQLVLSRLWTHLISRYSCLTFYPLLVYLIIFGILFHHDARGNGLQAGFIALVVHLSGVIEIVISEAVMIYFWDDNAGKSRHDRVTVLRNGMKEKIRSEKFVVGDIACLNSGDIIPANGVFLNGSDQFTVGCGGSNEAQQIVGDVEDQIIATGYQSSLFLSSGSKVKQGDAKMLVIGVGKNQICYEERCSDGTDDDDDDAYNSRNTELSKQTCSVAKYARYFEWLVISPALLIISLYQYFSGHSVNNNGHNNEFIKGQTSAFEASYVVLGLMLAIVLALVRISVKRFGNLVVNVTFNHAVNHMAKHNVIIRSHSAWEKLGFCVASKEVELNDQLALTSQFISVSEFSGHNTVEESDSSKMNAKFVDLIRESICFNTSGTTYSVGNRKSIERVVLLGFAVELRKVWEELNQRCKVVKVDSMENNKDRRVILEVKYGDISTYHVHKRGLVDAGFDVASFSGYYDVASGLPNSLDHGFCTSLVQKLLGITTTSESSKLIALSYRQISEHDYANDPDLNNEKEAHYNLLGFLETDRLLNVLDADKLQASFNVDIEEDCENQSPTSSKPSASITFCIANVNEAHLLDTNNEGVGEDESEPSSEPNTSCVVTVKQPLASSHLNAELSVGNEEYDDDGKSSTCSGENTSLDVRNEGDSGEEHESASVELTNSKPVGTNGGSENIDQLKQNIVIYNGDDGTVKLIRSQAIRVLCNVQTFIQFMVTTHIASSINTLIWFAPLITGIPTNQEMLIVKVVHFVLVTPGMIRLAASTYGRQNPDPRQDPPPPNGEIRWILLTDFMWINIITQVAYQVFVISMLQFGGPGIFEFPATNTRDTVILVTTILLQAFNFVNARKIEEKNIFSGMRWYFPGIVVILMAVPFGLVEALRLYFPTGIVRLDLQQWAICFSFAAASWLVAFIVKLLIPRNRCHGVGSFFTCLKVWGDRVVAVFSPLKVWTSSPTSIVV